MHIRAQLKDLMCLPDRHMLKYQEGAQVFISESGLYSLVLGSQKAEAKVFQRWITKRGFAKHSQDRTIHIEHRHRHVKEAGRVGNGRD